MVPSRQAVLVILFKACLDLPLLVVHMAVRYAIGYMSAVAISNSIRRKNKQEEIL